ncbi:Alpha-ketoglutarate dehydrogenase component 4, partial [Lemmus lemmus]
CCKSATIEKARVVRYGREEGRVRERRGGVGPYSSSVTSHRLRPTLPTPDTSAARLRPGSCPCSGVTMGSKMASASRVVQVVKPHAPLIRFPDRRDNPKLSASDVLRSAGLPSHSSVISQHSKGSISPDLLMHPGPPDTAEILKTLPQKYRRKPISQEEMDFIQRGGPE